MPDLKTTRHPASICNGCGNEIDASSHPDATPEVGDFSICAYCAHIGVFDENLNVIDIPNGTMIPTRVLLAAARFKEEIERARN